MIETKVNENETPDVVPIDDILRKIYAGKAVRYDHVTIIGEFDISNNSVFGNDAYMRSHINTSIAIINSTIKNDTIFNGIIFLGEINFTGTNFEGKTYFNNSQFMNAVKFEKSNFKKIALFNSTNFLNLSNFNETNYYETACFQNSIFSEDAYFSEARFSGVTEFRRSTFNKRAIFSGTKFNWCEFPNCLFKKDALFENSKFSNSTTFRGSIFNKTYFKNSRFNGFASFADVVFKKDLHFETSDFSKLAYFKQTIFKENALFIGTIFDGAASFYGARFEKTVDFRNAIFNGSDISPLIELIVDGADTEPIIYMDLKWLEPGHNIIRVNQSFKGDFEVDNALVLDELLDTDIKYVSGLGYENTKRNQRISIFRVNGYPDPELFLINNGIKLSIKFKRNKSSGNLTIFISGVVLQVNNLSQCADFENAVFNRSIFGQKYILPFGGLRRLDTNNEYYGPSYDNYGSSSFLGNVSFFKSTFNGQADFYNAYFYEIADFGNSRFKDTANFDGSNFLGYADFENAFSKDFNFYNTRFLDRLRLEEMKFTNLEMEWKSIENILVCDGVTYLALIKNFKDHEQFGDADDCYYYYMLWKQEQTSWLSLSKYLDLFALITCGYGVRWHYTIILALVVMIVIGIYFSFKEGIVMLHIRGKFPDIWKSIFFSSVILISAPTDWYPRIFGETKYNGYIINNRYSILLERMIGWSLLILLINTLSRVMIRY